MKTQMSRKLKRMTQPYYWVIPVILLYIIALSFFLAGMGMKLLGYTESKAEPAEFHVYDGEDIYSSLKAQMMTQEFASDFKETNHYYFAYNEELLPFIVQVHGKLSKEYLRIQSYLYDESEEVPEPAVFYGMSAPIEEDIRKYAIDSYNDMWGQKLVTEDNFSAYFGEYYLDTTRKPVSNAWKTVFIIFLHAFTAALAGTLVLVFNLNIRRFRRSRATRKTWPEESLLQSDGQLQDAFSLTYGKQISAALERNPSGPFLGVAGALFASLLGVGLWVVIGQVGFVAGVTGFVMLKLALSGYEKFGGSLDKRGAVICLIITAVMITGASLLDYAVSMVRVYFQYEASFETLAYVFTNFGSLMSEMNMWNSFFLDLAIGCGLSIWSAAGAMKAIINVEKNFRKRGE